MLARHLLSLGHRRFAYLRFARARRDHDRLDAIRACLAEHDLDLDVYEGGTPTSAEGERVCSAILLGGNPPDALICYNDLIALGFMKAAQSLGFKLPEDISVAGFDNIQYGLYTSPPLTTVDLQSERMGAVAMEKLIATIDGKEPPSTTMIEPQLILRGSTIKRN